MQNADEFEKLELMFQVPSGDQEDDAADISSIATSDMSVDFSSYVDFGSDEDGEEGEERVEIEQASDGVVGDASSFESEEMVGKDTKLFGACCTGPADGVVVDQGLRLKHIAPPDPVADQTTGNQQSRAGTKEASTTPR